MKITILSLASIFGAVAAFAPTQNSLNKKASTWALHAVRREELKGYYTLDRDIGDKIPKDFGFDPLGLAKTKGGLYFMREAEIKHARLAMLAVSSIAARCRYGGFAFTKLLSSLLFLFSTGCGLAGGGTVRSAARQSVWCRPRR